MPLLRVPESSAGGYRGAAGGVTRVNGDGVAEARVRHGGGYLGSPEVLGRFMMAYTSTRKPMMITMGARLIRLQLYTWSG